MAYRGLGFENCDSPGFRLAGFGASRFEKSHSNQNLSIRIQFIVKTTLIC